MMLVHSLTEESVRLVLFYVQVALCPEEDTETRNFYSFTQLQLRLSLSLHVVSIGASLACCMKGASMQKVYSMGLWSTINYISDHVIIVGRWLLF